MNRSLVTPRVIGSSEMKNSYDETEFYANSSQVANYWKKFFLKRKKDANEFIPENLLFVLFTLKQFLYFLYGFHSPAVEVVQIIVGKLVDLRFEIPKNVDFGHMHLRNKLLRGVLDYGFQNPSIVQKLSILPLWIGMNAIIRAQSGTGKTSTYCIAIAQQIDFSSDNLQAIVLLPSQDLSRSIDVLMKGLARHLDLKSSACVRNHDSIADSIDKKNGFPQVIFGTPKLVSDLIQASAIRIEDVKILIIDEIEEIVDHNRFSQPIPEIYYELSLLNPELQVGIYHSNAIMSPNCEALVEILTKDKFVVKIDTFLDPPLTLEGCKQHYVNCEKEEWKLDVICDLYDTLNFAYSIIFCNTRKKAQWLKERLKEREFSVECIVGDMDPNERTTIISNFNQGQFRILIATDLSFSPRPFHSYSNLLIHFDLCQNLDNYLRRIGSGKHGRVGSRILSILLVTNETRTRLRELEEYYSVRIDELPSYCQDLI